MHPSIVIILAELRDADDHAEAVLTLQMSKGGKPDYDKDGAEYYMNLLETRKMFLRQALEMLVYALKQKLADKKALKPEILKRPKQKPLAKKAPAKRRQSVKGTLRKGPKTKQTQREPVIR